MRTESLLSQSQSLAQELQSRQAELQETNERLEQQAKSLSESEELLKHQQEELQQTNRELEEKAGLLAKQKAEVEEKNQEIEQARAAIEEKAEQLALTSKYKSEFLANMSHELRTPLNSMLILSRMLAESDDGMTAKQIEYAETIHSSGSDLLGLINEILDLSKIEAGAMAVEPEPVRPEALAEDLDRMFREVASDKNLDFKVEIGRGMPDRIVTDQKRLQQVLKNLLSNAVKFTHEGGVTLRMTTVKAGNRPIGFPTEPLRAADTVIAFAVEDTGIGIAEDKQRVIFEAFQQADGSVDRAYGGTGLGLSISREIARLLGGAIELESMPGEGSTFTLLLPAIYTEPERPDHPDDVDLDPYDDGGDGSAHFTPTPPARPAPTARPAPSSGDGARTAAAAPAPPPAPAKAAPAPAAAPTARAPEPAKAPAQPAPPPRPTPAGTAAAGPASKAAEPEPEHIRGHSAAVVEDDRDKIKPGDAVLLIVEDDRRFAQILLDIAREKGFKAIHAEHAEAALAAIKRYQPSAITLDVKLPGMHGLTLLDRIKNQPETRHIPVQIVSVTGPLPRRKRKGIIAQLQKPVTPEIVKSQLDRMRSLSERKQKRLLVVEDNEVQRRLVEEFIGGEDVHIVGVARGEDALTALQAARDNGDHFDCALIDLGLPDMSGFDLIGRIREELELTDLPVIVHTGRELRPEEAERLHELAEAVVVKDADAYDRLLDETALYLHRVEAELPEEQRDRLEKLHTPAASLAGKKVLIVDDDVRNIFALTSLLEQHGMEVVYAEGGREGVDFLSKSDDVDAVLMDVMMPGMDGYEATKSIRQDGRFTDLPVIMVTAKAMKGDREKCLAAGASDYLTKPVNVDQLLSLLRVWLAK